LTSKVVSIVARIRELHTFEPAMIPNLAKRKAPALLARYPLTLFVRTASPQGAKPPRSPATFLFSFFFSSASLHELTFASRPELADVCQLPK
jgi:hypothetical protein